MSEDEERDIITLSTGKQVYAHHLILGIAPDLSLYHGHDGSIEYNGRERWNHLTKWEVLELADIAIKRWRKLSTIMMDEMGLPKVCHEPRP